MYPAPSQANVVRRMRHNRLAVPLEYSKCVRGGNSSSQGYEGYNYGSGGGYKYADYEYATDYHDDPAPK